jgi:hypothetical protein
VSINPRYQKLWDKIVKFLKEQGGLLLERYDKIELEKYFGADLVLSLLKIQESRLNAENKLAGYRCGSVVEKKSLNNADFEICFLKNGFYPLSALLEGRFVLMGDLAIIEHTHSYIHKYKYIYIYIYIYMHKHTFT